MKLCKSCLYVAAFLAFLLSTTCHATPVSPEEALTVAANWLASNGTLLGKDTARTLGDSAEPLTEQSGDVVAYAIQLEPEGFIIVAADDAIDPILAVSGTGSFSDRPSENNVLYGMLLQDVPDRLSHLSKMSTTYKQAVTDRWQCLTSTAQSPTRSSDENVVQKVSPFLVTEWDQGNQAYPYTYEQDVPNHYVAGCVAIAMAQTIRYFKYPHAASGAGNIFVDGSAQYASFADTYNYDLMPEKLQDDSGWVSNHQDNVDEVAKLVFDCGISVAMQYTNGSSGAYMTDVAGALTGDFGYSSASWEYGTSVGWETTVESETEALYPVIFGIRDPNNGGHAVVCDGWGTYSGSSSPLFHLNFGWGDSNPGSNDPNQAWYSVPGFSAGGYDWSVLDGIVYNIRPQTSATGSISGHVCTASAASFSNIVESPHPYTNEYEQTWTVTGADTAYGIRVHFDYIETEYVWDDVDILDADDNIIQSYTGSYSDVWSPWVRGSVIKIRLKSDYSNYDYRGFRSDSFQCEGNPIAKAGVTVSLSPAVVSPVTTDGSGAYTFSNLPSGTYIVEPSSPGCSFDPAQQNVDLGSGVSRKDVDFLQLIRSPQNVSLSPKGGELATGTNLTFTADYSDPDGCANLAGCYVLINTTLSAAKAICLYYNENQNKLYLRNDANSGWLGGYAPGSTSTIENSYCKVYCGETTVSESGNEVTVKWKVSAKPTMAGKTCPAWMLATDESGIKDGWEQMTSYKFDQPPVNVSLSPSGGSFSPNTKYVFTANYSDAEGYDNLVRCYVLINTTLSGAKAMYLYYNEDRNKLYLRNDGNTAWLGGYTPGSDGVIENSYCKVYCAETTVSKTGNQVTVNWKVSVKPTMSGKTCPAWMLAVDGTGLQDGWDQMTTYKFGQPPVNVSLSPATGTFLAGTKYVFIAKYSDPDGYANLAGCYVLFNTTLSGAKAVCLYYNEDQNKLYLRNDANTAWLGGYAPGAAVVIENGYCKLYCADSTVSKVGNQVTVNWKVSAKSTMSGKACPGWMLATDGAGLRDGWEQFANIRFK